LKYWIRENAGPVLDQVLTELAAVLDEVALSRIPCIGTIAQQRVLDFLASILKIKRTCQQKPRSVASCSAGRLVFVAPAVVPYSDDRTFQSTLCIPRQVGAFLF